MIIRDRAFIQDGEIPIKLIKNCIKEHQDKIDRFNKLADYYDGEHIIKSRTLSNSSLPNNKLVANHAEYITDVATGYFMGNAIKYVDDDIEVIQDNFKDNVIHNIDTELARDISKFGVGFELVYMSSDAVPVPKSTNIDPRNIFLVVDDTVEYKPMFAVHYYSKKDIEGKEEGYIIKVYTERYIITYFIKELTGENYQELDRVEHFFNSVPVIEYWNKSNQQGDFEGVISLIDAYNLLQSDRVNDKEQLIDALLAVTGANFGDSEEEMTNTAKFLKLFKILELPEGGKAEWLTKSLNETEVEVLKKSLKDDIHEFAKVPCLTDENFASQASGVSMKYKLFGLEQLAKTKEGYYRIGLRERLRLYSNIYNTKGYNLTVDNTEIQFSRSLPVNEIELSQMVNTLNGIVSKETLLGLLPFVQDIEREIEAVDEEQQKAIEQQQKAFGSYDFKQVDNQDTGAKEGVN